MVGGAGAHRRQPAQLLDRLGPTTSSATTQNNVAAAGDDLICKVVDESAPAEMGLRGLVHEPDHQRRDILGHDGV